MPTGLGVDFKQLSQLKLSQLKQLNLRPEQWKQFQKLTQNLDVYEKLVREAVKNLDLKSQQARKISEARLKEVSQQIQKTRGDVERRVKGLLEEEAKKLNVRLREIYSYLVKVAQKEQAAPVATKSGKKPARKATQSGKTASAKTAAPSGSRKRRTKSAAAESTATAEPGKPSTPSVH